MQRGQHVRLLRAVLMHLEEHGHQLAELARQAHICSRLPGRALYDNKCEFPNGFYVAVLQPPGRRNRANQLAWGIGSGTPTARGPETSAWNMSDEEVAEYARSVTPWVVAQLLGVGTST